MTHTKTYVNLVLKVAREITPFNGLVILPKVIINSIDNSYLKFYICRLIKKLGIIFKKCKTKD